MRVSLLAILALAAVTAGCPSVEDPDDINPNEVITAVNLTFTPTAGAAVTASWSDPEGDGDPVIDSFTLANGTAYALTVEFLNELADPVEDITEEIQDEQDEHQILIYGSGVSGPAAGANANARVEHEYDDVDSNNLPIGLESTITGISAGTGDFKLMLRHMPPGSDGTPVKSATIAEDFATGGSAGIGGSVDIDITFPLQVQ